MTIDEATVAGVARVRRPCWAQPGAYLKIDLIESGGKRYRGPWYHLFERPTQQAIGEPTPQTFLGLADATEDYEAYNGPLDVADTAPAGPVTPGG